MPTERRFANRVSLEGAEAIRAHFGGERVRPSGMYQI